MVYRRRTKTTFSWWQMLFMLAGVVAMFYLWQSLTTTPNPSLGLEGGIPTLPSHLTRADVLPTPTLNVSVPLRQLIFPGAQSVARVVEAYRLDDSWDVRNLGDLVGHLAGTGWINDPGGNIALVGHVEDADGNPGPFAFMSHAKVGDVVILRDGEHEVFYHVLTVTKAAPEDIAFVAQDGRRRLTLITCSDWDVKTAAYLNRLIVVAVPS